MKKMNAKILVLLLAVAVLSIVPTMGYFDNAHDEFSKYLGHEVSINACNQTVYQGIVTENWASSGGVIPGHIVLKEMCNPELGNVTLSKLCIVYIHEGYTCKG